MRCFACNTQLSDFEATRKAVQENGKVVYPDLCDECFYASGMGSIATVVEREDLKTYTIEDLYDEGETSYEEY